MTTSPAFEVAQQLIQVVSAMVHPERAELRVEACELPGEPLPFEEVVGMGFEPFEVGWPWGGRWGTTWFRLCGSIPAGWGGAEVVALVHLGNERHTEVGAEGLIWDRAGRPLQGLHHAHRTFLLAAPASGGERVELYVEAASNPVPPKGLAEWPVLAPDYRGERLYVLEQAEIATVDPEALALLYDLRVVADLAACGRLPPDADRALVGAARALETGDDGAGAAARRALEPVLCAPTASTHVVTAVGHAHIDSAWLWPARETRRKCARTFANQLRLMERYPEHRFACSQAVQYQWIQDDYPAIFDQIKARVRDGRWEPVGGMWVEPDTNLPSGESLVRQLVYGKRFFAEELGVDSAELWIPDVFGYSAALPQIARGAGVEALVTQKMSWNDTNAFPHTTFWWEGHDGSRILAHFPPADTYNGRFSVSDVAAGEEHHHERDRSDRSLYPFGFGDGGGGPTAEMIERSRRLRSLHGLPRVQIGRVGGFLDEVHREARGLPTWVGELYLEKHRGTYTTHADVKLANRRCEEALRAAEMWSTAAGLDRRDHLEGAWKALLFHQFHDILPGSSIHWVYEDAAGSYAEIARAAAAVSAESRALLAGSPPAQNPGGNRVAFNAASHDRREVLDLDGRLAMVSVPACGWTTVTPAESWRSTPVEVGATSMRNEHLEVRWDPDGLLVSVRDLEAAREVLSPGTRGNVFELHEDRPAEFDAWDIDRSSLDDFIELVDLESVDVVEEGGLRGAVRFVRRFGASEISQTVSLDAGSRRLELHTDVDWHERHKLLKVAFDVAVRSARATYEIQHGHIERPTTANTSWDEARFEVCGHRWADLSEPGYGVALINDCKYGYDVRGHHMRLSLLRAPGYPDPLADQGRHRFAYALLPHAGDLREGQVVEEAESFNLPMVVVPGAPGAQGRVVTVDRRGVSVEAVKLADRDDAVVVRICEVWGSRGPVRVSLGLPWTSVTRCDLLERHVAPVDTDGTTVHLELRPFELVSLKFRRR
ncbi:MAG: alpha-mannosidase [Acidimicrobiales bacterium]